MSKVLRVQADYNCYSIWSDHDSDYLEPADLGLSEGLGERIKAWEQRCDATYDSGFASDSDRERFHADGQQLVSAIQQEVGPDYSVQYLEGI